MAALVPLSRPTSDKLFSREVDQLSAGPRAILADPSASDAAREFAEHQLSQLSRKARSQGDWRFFMAGVENLEQVFNWMADNSKRLRLWNRVWALIPAHFNRHTNELELTRDQLAEKTGASPRDISLVMSELEECGAIIRRRERVAGLRGPGVVRYFLNSNFVTKERGEARDNMQLRDRSELSARRKHLRLVASSPSTERRSRAPSVPGPVL